MTNLQNVVKILPKMSIAWVGRTNVTDRRQTDRRTDDDIIANMNLSSRSLKRNSEMWQVTYLSRPLTSCYAHQSCHAGWGPGRSQPCQVLSKSVQEFWLPEWSKSAIFQCLALWFIVYTTDKGYRPTCDSKCVLKINRTWFWCRPRLFRAYILSFFVTSEKVQIHEVLSWRKTI